MKKILFISTLILNFSFMQKLGMVTPSNNSATGITLGISKLMDCDECDILQKISLAYLTRSGIEIALDGGFSERSGVEGNENWEELTKLTKINITQHIKYRGFNLAISLGNEKNKVELNEYSANLANIESEGLNLGLYFYTNDGTYIGLKKNEGDLTQSSPLSYLTGFNYKVSYSSEELIIGNLMPLSDNSWLDFFYEASIDDLDSGELYIGIGYKF